MELSDAERRVLEWFALKGRPPRILNTVSTHVIPGGKSLPNPALVAAKTDLDDFLLRSEPPALQTLSSLATRRWVVPTVVVVPQVGPTHVYALMPDAVPEIRSIRLGAQRTNKRTRRKKAKPDDDVLRFIKQLNHPRNRELSKYEVAIRFTEENEQDAQRLLKQVQPSRWGHLVRRPDK